MVDLFPSLVFKEMSCLLGRIFSPLGAYQSISLASPSTERDGKSEARKLEVFYTCLNTNVDWNYQLRIYTIRTSSESVFCRYSNIFIPNVWHHRCSARSIVGGRTRRIHIRVVCVHAINHKLLWQCLGDIIVKSKAIVSPAEDQTQSSNGNASSVF